MTVFIACTLSKLDTESEANLSKSLHWIDTAQNLKVYFNVRNFEIYADSVMDGNGINNIIEFKYKQASVTQIITCKKLKGKKESYIDVHVLDHDDSSQLSLLKPDLHENTYYLPYKPNTATYMHLNWHATPGHLFITQQLSGCDIWIADSVDLDRSTGPLIVHVNANAAYDEFIRSEKNPKKYLIHKRNLATDALELFNANLGKKEHKYKFYCHISHDLIKSIEYDFYNNPIEKEKMEKEIKNYWNDKIPKYRYSEKYWPIAEEYKYLALFYGTYYCDEGSHVMHRGKWQFKFRVGDLIKEVDYSEQQCTIEEINVRFSHTCT